MNRQWLLLACTSLVIAVANAADSQDHTSATKVTPILTRPLPDLHGKEVTMLTVEYAPGASSPPHRHDANTFVYVLEGSVVMQVAGGKDVILKPGDTFYESPNDIHSVSRNASTTERAKFLVFFVKNVGEPVSTPIEK
jgi:quercetin dioxygenase-like cupin family protein